MRYSEDEPASVVLDRLAANKPRLRVRRKPNGLKVHVNEAGQEEAPESFDQRLAAWRSAIEREKARAKNE